MTYQHKVLACFTDPRLAGPGKRSISVSEKLDARGVKVDFLIPKGANDFADAAKEIGASVTRFELPRIRNLDRVGENIRFITSFYTKSRNLETFFHTEKYDIIHVNTPYNFQPAYAATRSSSMLVWHFNDVLTPWPLNRVSGFLANRWADAIAVSSEGASDYFRLGKQTTTVLHPPVDLEKFNPNRFMNNKEKLCSELKINPDTFLIGAAGNIHPMKGYDILIKAIDKICKKHEDVTLVIAGSQLDSREDYYHSLQSQIQARGLERRINFVGWRDDMPKFLSALDLLTVASRSETGPMIGLEALATGCPVVTTAVGALAEQAVDGYHCWIVQPNDVDALARAISTAIQSPNQRGELADAGRQLIKETFSLEAIVDEHLRLYDKNSNFRD